MAILTQDPTITTAAANLHSLADRLKRDIGMHRAAQTLADATRCQRGLRPMSLRDLDPSEREWFRQAARNVIEVFETETTEREPDDDRMRREMAAVREARTESNLIASSRARAIYRATHLGHRLGHWESAPIDGSPSRERAACQTCGRTVFVDTTCDVPFSGMAIEVGCLVVAEPRA